MAMPRRDIWAVVPVKQFSAAKQRLSLGFPPEFRERLALTMLRDVLAALAGSRLLGGIIVVTADPLAAHVACEFGARVVSQDATGGHTVAVMSAARMLAAEGAAGMVTVPGDMPGATSEEIDNLLGGHAEAPAFSIVPAHDGRGSNAVVCSPPDLLQLTFGDDSCLPHIALARAAGLYPRIVNLTGISMDIDTPEDLLAFARHDWPTGTQRFLHQSGALSGSVRR